MAKAAEQVCCTPEYWVENNIAKPKKIVQDAYQEVSLNQRADAKKLLEKYKKI